MNKLINVCVILIISIRKSFNQNSINYSLSIISGVLVLLLFENSSTPFFVTRRYLFWIIKIGHRTLKTMNLRRTNPPRKSSKNEHT